MKGDETIQVKTATGKNRDGDTTYASPRDIVSCIIWPRDSGEVPGRGVVIIEGLNVFIPPDATPPTAKDRIIARGNEYDVDGVPGQYRMSGTDRGYLVVLKKLGT